MKAVIMAAGVDVCRVSRVNVRMPAAGQRGERVLDGGHRITEGAAGHDSLRAGTCAASLAECRPDPHPFRCGHLEASLCHQQHC